MCREAVDELEWGEGGPKRRRHSIALVFLQEGPRGVEEDPAIIQVEYTLLDCLDQ